MTRNCTLFDLPVKQNFFISIASTQIKVAYSLLEGTLRALRVIFLEMFVVDGIVNFVFDKVLQRCNPLLFVVLIGNE